MISFPIFIMLVFQPDFFIRFLYGEDYSGASFPLVILAFGVMINISVGLVGMILNGIDRPRLTLISDLIGAIFNIVLNVILIPIFGILGAAVATSTSLSLRNIVALLFTYYHLKILPWDINYVKIIMLTIFFGLLNVLFIDHISISYEGMVYSILGIKIGISLLINFVIISTYILFCYFLFYKLNFLDKYDKSILHTLSKKFKT